MSFNCSFPIMVFWVMFLHSWFSNCGFLIVVLESWFSNCGFPIMVLELWFSNHGFLIMVLELWFWNYGFLIMVFQSWFWNCGFPIMVLVLWFFAEFLLGFWMSGSLSSLVIFGFEMWFFDSWLVLGFAFFFCFKKAASARME